MSNIITIKHGANIPTIKQLEEYELGYSTTNKKLYINGNGEIITLNKDQIIISNEIFPSEDNNKTIWIDNETNLIYYINYDIEKNKYILIPCKAKVAESLEVEIDAEINNTTDNQILNIPFKIMTINNYNNLSTKENCLYFVYEEKE